MRPLTRGQSRGLQAWGEFATEDEKSQDGAYRGAWKLSATAAFVRHFLLDKVGDLLGLQRWPGQAVGTKRGRQKPPGHA